MVVVGSFLLLDNDGDDRASASAVLDGKRLPFFLFLLLLLLPLSNDEIPMLLMMILTPLWS